MADVFTKTKRSAGNFATGRGGVRAYFAAPPMKDHTDARLLRLPCQDREKRSPLRA